MKVTQAIFSILTLILIMLSVIKVLETDKFTSIDYLILSNASMFITVILAGLSNNGKDSKEKPGLSE